MRQDHVDTTIAKFHEAALRPEAWPDALSELAAASRANLALAQMVGQNGYEQVISRGREGLIGEYIREGWHERNPRMTRSLTLTRRGFRGLITEQNIFTPEELARDAFQQEFAPRYEVSSSAGIMMAAHAGSQFILTIERGVQLNPYSESELADMNRLVEAFSTACSFALRLKLTAANAMLDTLGASGEALALLTPTGRVLHATPAFEALLRGRLALRGGVVQALDPDENAELQGLILRSGASLLAPDAPLAPVVLARQPGTPLVARCLPVAGAARDFLGLARTVIAIDELSPPKPAGSDAILRRAFGLTPAEARLAARVAEGLSLREAADAEHVTFETARTRLKAVFAKTGTGRQAELALLVARLAAR